MNHNFMHQNVMNQNVMHEGTIDQTTANLASPLLDDAFVDRSPIPRQLWGFGGVHGGLALAMTLRAMCDGSDRRVRSVTGHFLRPTRDDVAIVVDHDGEPAGRTTERRSATMWSGGRRSIRATAILGGGAVHASALAPSMPRVPQPLDCAVFDLPAELVPFGASIELRPTDERRPYIGAAEPALSAWIRVRGDDTPVDLARLVMLGDALAPSYTATITDVVVAPTIELSVRPSSEIDHTCSPWLLVDAHTTSVSDDGWLVEHIETFGPDGTHLGSAEQLRLARQL